jgi:hypothetical protein
MTHDLPTLTARVERLRARLRAAVRYAVRAEVQP